MPRVSVIIPVFGETPHLAECRNAVCFKISRAAETLRERGLAFCLRRLLGKMARLP